MILQSDDVTKIAPAFLEAQKKMKAGVREGTSHNGQFMRLEDVWAACRPALNENGISIVQGAAAEGDKAYIVTTLVHTSGQFFRGYFELVADKQPGPQGVGSAITYMRRYSLASMAGVIDGVDDDGESAKPEPKPVIKPKLSTAQEIGNIKVKLDEKSYTFTVDAWRKKHSIATTEFGTEKQQKELLAALNRELKEADQHAEGPAFS